jgi:hypothetical protein
VPAFPQTPNIPNPPIVPPYNPEFQRQNKFKSDYENNLAEKFNDLENNLRLKLSSVR